MKQEIPELYGRLHELIEAFQAGQISVKYYSKRHANITEQISKHRGIDMITDSPDTTTGLFRVARESEDTPLKDN